MGARLRRAAALLAAACLLLAAPAARGAGWHDRKAAVAELAPGRLLVASRDLADPNFRHTVVLLVAYGGDGALGLVVNRPTRIPFSEAIPEIDALKRLGATLYLGGPVARYRVALLVRSPRPLPEGEGRRVFDSVYYTTRLKTLLALARKPRPEVTLHAYAGHAGWAPGQLESEILRGGWFVTRADAALLFDRPAAELWPTLIERVDPRLLQARLE
ncbi:MAG: hypothetical protein D6739_06695 [Nitrospirae bacterium]|nr:MAG: hypothetical protein D6739_06695 [Nitrospirota bacterium]